MVPTPQKTEQLEQAFAAFNQTSGHLEESYRDLKQQVASLTDELARTRSARLTDREEQEVTHRNERLVVMGEMAASLTHQIRTPLATAILYASQMHSNDMSLHDRERFSDRLMERLRHIETMISDMLRFSRIGRYEADVTPVALFFEKLALALEADIQHYQTTIRFECEEPGAVIVGHADALQSALVNLVINAMQSHPGQAEISLSFKSDKLGQYSLTVKDNGPGISAEIQNKIFNPFFTTRSDGTGLGLAVVESIVHAHGGTVKCVSAAEEGCLFTLTLPHQIPAGNQNINGRNT